MTVEKKIQQNFYKALRKKKSIERSFFFFDMSAQKRREDLN
jgi:hypothetical protein